MKSFKKLPKLRSADLDKAGEWLSAILQLAEVESKGDERVKEYLVRTYLKSDPVSHGNMSQALQDMLDDDEVRDALLGLAERPN